MRVMALPRRVLDLDSVPDVTSLFQKEGGALRFWPIQSAALVEASLADGLFAPIGVGYGKTLIALALPEAMNSKKAVLLVKSDLKRQLEREAEGFYGKHFDLPLDRITVVAYAQLSSAKHATILDDVGPDLIVADEAHALRHQSSARTKRFLRYFREHPACRFAGLSGTMTNRSIKDYAHLLELALRKNSPLPRGYREINDWAGALDVDPEYPMRSGALKQLCQNGENVREGFQRRLVETEGVVATEEGALGTSLVIRRLPIAIPSRVVATIEHVEAKWELGGDELATASEKARVIKQLNCGFYYRWAWPNNRPDTEWLDARAEWNREVREKLLRATEGLDSPLLLSQAAERYHKWESNGRPKPRPDKIWDSVTWGAWKRVKDRRPPPTESIWLDDYVVQAATAWAKEQTEPAIIWYWWNAVGERLARVSGFPHYGAGTDAGESTAPVIIASIQCQSTGKNLQHYSRNLLITVPPNGTTFEQIAGRTHRPGQLADEIVLDWFGFNDNAMFQVVEDAEYMQTTTGQRQKVLYATRIKK
jgi:hypothetical protein